MDDVFFPHGLNEDFNMKVMFLFMIILQRQWMFFSGNALIYVIYPMFLYSHLCFGHFLLSFFVMSLGEMLCPVLFCF